MLDLMFRNLQRPKSSEDDENQKDLKFKFTTQSIVKCVLLSLKIDNLHRMGKEYPEFYQELF